MLRIRRNVSRTQHYKRRSVGRRAEGHRPVAPCSAVQYNLSMRERGAADSGILSAAEEDSRLVRRVRAGDAAAEELLVQRHYRSVFNLAFRLSGDYDNAQDIVSEAFMRVHTALPNFRGDATFTTWLYRIVKNVFLDDRKKRRLRTH